MLEREVVSIKLDHLSKAIKKDKISSCIIYKDDFTVFEYYRNRKIKDKQHKVYSITKSIISALCGIAIQQGYVESENVSVSNFFSDIEDSKKDIKIKHLLMMASGLSWPGNEAMMSTKNWVKFILEQPVELEPGVEMKYSCGNSHLVSAILQQTTKMDTVSFATKYLFSPLGIKDYHWHRDAQGIPIGGFSMTMKIEDMLKFGILYLNQGKWKGKQLIPAEWIKESTDSKIILSEDISYGYHWWILNKDDEKRKTYYAMGMRGQYIFVNEENRLVTVITSSMEEDASSPIEYFRNYILC
ncbi:serine hydrolase domain-containing protein [Paenibacillus sp. JSM ZJ436]|uniref:serine hydrolase domain-containing protein n=1 Tax=Paenibacillus sp. JSM ZJ436 TaxID=3376190 RepID=UPI0037B18BD3